MNFLIPRYFFYIILSFGSVFSAIANADSYLSQSVLQGYFNRLATVTNTGEVDKIFRELKSEHPRELIYISLSLAHAIETGAVKNDMLQKNRVAFRSARGILGEVNVPVFQSGKPQSRLDYVLVSLEAQLKDERSSKIVIPFLVDKVMLNEKLSERIRELGSVALFLTGRRDAEIDRRINETNWTSQSRFEVEKRERVLEALSRMEHTVPFIEERKLVEDKKSSQYNSGPFLVQNLEQIALDKVAAKDSCETFRLDELGGSLSTVPVYDQGSLGICYGTSAATLYEAWIESHFGGRDEDRRLYRAQKGSALEAAIGTTVHNNLQQQMLVRDGTLFNRCDINGGFEFEVLKYLIDHGLCDGQKIQEAFQGEDAGKFVDRLKRDVLLKEVLNEDYGKYNSVFAGYPNSQLQQLFNQLRKDVFDTGEKRIEDIDDCERLSPLARQRISPQVDKLKKQLFGIDSMPLVHETLVQYCESSGLGIRKAHQTLAARTLYRESESRWGASKEQMQKKLLFAWGSQTPKQPIILGMHSSILFPASSSELKEDSTPEEMSDGHGIVAAGQRWNRAQGRCEILLRNSWGTGPGSCKSYAPEIQCEEQTGSVWVERSKLMENTFRITYLEEQKDPLPLFEPLPDTR